MVRVRSSVGHGIASAPRRSGDGEGIAAGSTTGRSASFSEKLVFIRSADHAPKSLFLRCSANWLIVIYTLPA
uniref:Uncharacterized protein n=1 Tax=Steinernema glaseri TaxID=37863 RepID=A0A1I8AGN6_9BILA